MAQVAGGEDQERQREDQRQQRRIVRVHVGGEQAHPDEHGERHRATEPLVFQLRAEVIRQPDEQQRQHRRHAHLDHRNVQAELVAEVGDQRREAGRVEVVNLRVEGRERVEAAAQPRRQRQIAEALRVGVERHGRDQRGDDEDQRGESEQQQVAPARPALIGVEQGFAALFGALLPVGERPEQEDARHQREQQVIDHQRVPAEQHRPEDRAADDHAQRQRRRQPDARLMGGPGGREHRPRADHHRAENEDDE